MEQCYRKPLFRCSYEVLKGEAERHFETTDPRVIEKYIGRPAGIKRHSGNSVTRQNMNRGSVAQFHYHNERIIEARIGLAQRLGYITQEGNLYTLHHEKMSYYTVQKELANQPSRSNEKAGV